MYARTEDFFIFLQELDEKAEADAEKLKGMPELKHLKYIDQKIVDLQIFTEYVRDLQKRVQEASSSSGI